MLRKEAFDISYYDVADNCISFKGRVLSDLNIGDKLLYIFYENQKETIKEYIIQKIVAYQNEFNIINAGMTCEIIVAGDDFGFRSNRFLYM